MNPELQKARKAAIKSKIVKCTVMSIVGATVASIAFNAMSGLEAILAAIIGFAIFASMTGVVITAFSQNRAYAAFSALYKKEAITSALRGASLFEEMEFDYDAGLNPNVVTGSGMLTANRYFSNCFLSAKHNGVSFVQADVRNVRGDRNGYALEYDGTFLVIPVNLPDAGETTIAQKGVDVSYILPGKPFTTPNAEFNKRFKVSTATPTQAAALLDSTVTSSLLSIADRITGRMLLTVKGGKLYLFLSRKGSALKPNLLKSYDDSMRESVIKELSRAKIFIEYFSY